MAAPALVAGDVVYLADEVQLVCFAQVTRLTSKTAIATLLEKRGVSPPSADGIPGADDYLPGAPVGLEVTLMSNHFVRSGEDAKQRLLSWHKLNWGAHDGKPLSRIVTLH
jgi:hypothetical protein